MARGGRRGRSKQPNVPMCLDNTIVTQTEAIGREGDTIREVSSGTVTTEIQLARVSNTTLEMTYSPARSTISTFATMIDPDEGTSLFFHRSQVVNGVKCAKIEIQDLQPEIDYWKSAILCSVLGANLPLELIEGFVKHNFHEYIEFVNEHNVVVRQKVDYEWKPIKCGHCKMFRHNGDECRKKPQA
ncbi:hypothetical protein Cgig2_023908 [Carnegiea gigantea]|uniref:Uncharacterized protein n=1 Tax=Carnegiea gigantea TaxID=171969 RepID=A0A9Q1JG99_9CARY|nr:hypothetical protein Cgig2_023908 [Carnegiea gigantea]